MSTAAYTDSIERLLDLVQGTRWQDLPADARAAGTVFFMDTVGGACAGSLAPKLDAMVAVARQWDGGHGDGAALWNLGLRASAPVAALVNGYQCHALEYDCVYEPGVVLPAPPILAALMVHAERLAGAGQAPSGKDLLRAFIVALEVSCTLGAAARSGMFFFRPATTGTFSALAAIACLSPLPREQLRYAFGIAYSQMCGTMQAHEEGSMMLAMQMGFAARNAVQAYDMAAVGITAPVELLDGRFGYFHNFEHENTLAEALARIGSPWKVTQLSHKPFPSGRVTHGSIHALKLLQQELGLNPQNALARVRSIVLHLPPLGMRLVGRPIVENPTPNYARLCVPYVAACQLLHGRVDPGSFTPERLGDPAIQILARRVEVLERPHPDPNAFYPQHLRLTLDDGRVLEREIPFAWGHPEMPLNADEREDKFRLCWRLSHEPGDASEAALASALSELRDLGQATDCTGLLKLLAGLGGTSLS